MQIHRSFRNGEQCSKKPHSEATLPDKPGSPDVSSDIVVKCLTRHLLIKITVPIQVQNDAGNEEKSVSEEPSYY